MLLHDSSGRHCPVQHDNRYYMATNGFGMGATPRLKARSTSGSAQTPSPLTENAIIRVRGEEGREGPSIAVTQAYSIAIDHFEPVFTVKRAL